MKKIVLLVLLPLSTFCWAQLNQDQYSINVHVSSSRWFNAPEATNSRALQRLSVTIGGKKYELEYFSRGTTIGGGAAVLAPGENPFTNQRTNCGAKISAAIVPTIITAVITVIMMENVFWASEIGRASCRERV